MVAATTIIIGISKSSFRMPIEGNVWWSESQFSSDCYVSHMVNNRTWFSELSKSVYVK